MYSLIEIMSMQLQAQQLNLKYPPEFLTLPRQTLSEIFNGYGPEHWQKSRRELLTWFFRHYPAPAAIHDLRYEFSDGRESTRKAADAEFAANLLTVWLYRYGVLRWINPVALYDLWKIRSAARLTACCGRKAWWNSYRKNKQDSYYE